MCPLSAAAANNPISAAQAVRLGPRPTGIESSGILYLESLKDASANRQLENGQNRAALAWRASRTRRRKHLHFKLQTLMSTVIKLHTN